MSLVTVFTPAYNRAALLPRLCESLCRQTVFPCEWLIVDDGSADNTAAIVETLAAGCAFSVRYIRQENGGKHTAFNTGVAHASGELFFCVDSDDRLPPNAVAAIEAVWAEAERSSSAIGILGAKTDFDGKRLCAAIPAGEELTTYTLTRSRGIGGEFSLIYRTAVLREHPFPVIPGERFLTENVLYDVLDTVGPLRLTDAVLTECEYQAGGLSDGSRFYATMCRNPGGFALFYARRIDMAVTGRERLGYALRYRAFCRLSAPSAPPYHGTHRALVNLMSVPGRLLATYYRKKARQIS